MVCCAPQDKVLKDRLRQQHSIAGLEGRVAGLSSSKFALEEQLRRERAVFLARIRELEDEMNNSSRLVTDLSRSMDRGVSAESVASFVSSGSEMGFPKRSTSSRRSKASMVGDFVVGSESLQPLEDETSYLATPALPAQGQQRAAQALRSQRSSPLSAYSASRTSPLASPIARRDTVRQRSVQVLESSGSIGAMSVPAAVAVHEPRFECWHHFDCCRAAIVSSACCRQSKRRN